MHNKLESLLYSAKFQILSIIVIYISAAIFLNITTRLDLSQKELESRITPVVETLRLTKADDWILSDITSVFHLYADKNRNFIDCYATRMDRILQLQKTINGQIYLLRRENDKMNEKRYPEYFEMLSKLNYIYIKKIPPNYELIKFVNKI